MTDPGLQNEKFFSLPQGNPIWLSPAINLQGAISGQDNADFQQDNHVQFTYNTDASFQIPVDGPPTIKVDWYVGNPSLAMSPTLHTRKMPTAFPGNPNPGNPTTTPAPGNVWHPPSTGYDSTDPNDPENPATPHKCLIAVCYPSDLTPDPNAFHVGDDPHYAQHNIHIVAVQGGSGRRNRFSFKISTANPDAKTAQPATIQVVRDLNPTPEVRNFLAPRLQAVPGFKRISNQPLAQGFDLELPDFPNAVVHNNSRPGCLGFLLFLIALILGLFGVKIQLPTPEYEASIQLQPHQFTNFNFVTDLSGITPGDAYVYHLSHQAANQRILGGLTLVLVGQ